MPVDAAETFARIEAETREWVDGAAARARAYEDWIARTEAEASARSRRLTGAHEAIRELVEHRPWSIHPNLLAEARGLARLDRLDGRQERAAEIVDRSNDTVARAEARIREIDPEDPLLARAADPTVRQLALDAVRSITELDADRASKRNGIGWSQTTSVVGHVLSRKPELSVDETVAAVRILGMHRGQVREDHRAVLFG